MRKILFLILSISFSSIFASGLQIQGNIGYGLYDLEELKDIQASSIFLEEIESLTSFPGNIFYSGEICIVESNHVFGAGLDYLFTGARNHYEDYSGEYKMDMLIHAYKPCIKYQYQFETIQEIPLSFFIGAKAGITFTSLSIDEKLSLSDNILSSNEITLKRNSPYIEPTLNVIYPIGKGFLVNLMLGYEINLDHEFESLYPDDVDRLGIRADWSGLRVSFGLAYRLIFN